MKTRATAPAVAWGPLLALAAGKLVLHLLVIERYGFHRDELLYLALGDHPGFGYWSNAPLIGWISFAVQHTLGGALWATRLPVVLAGSGLLVLTGVTARELGGGRYAQLLAALAVLLSPAYLRTAHLFQPVVFDILAWTAMTFLLARYLNTERTRYVLLFGVVFGLGFLNKYSVAFLLVALLPALLLTPHRRILRSPAVLKAAGLALLIILPNLIWQARHGFPVVTHMQELAQYQLGNVTPAGFLIDQLVMNLPGLILWITGLAWLLRSEAARPYRLIGWLYVSIVALFLIVSGKSYYTLGIYPVLLAAGATAWAQYRRWLQAALPALMAVLLLPVLPLGIPVLPLGDLVDYCRWLAEDVGFDAPMRWEDGRVHALPQDFADMLGWPVLADLAETAVRTAGEPVLLYAENYGQAGAVAHLSRGLPPVQSFSDSYRLWVADSTAARALVYINDEMGEDVSALFSDIRPVGHIETPYARERGTTVYLCRRPVAPVDSLWRLRVGQMTERIR